MSTIAFNFVTGPTDTPTNATSVELSDPTGTFGVRRVDNGAIVVADGTALVNTSTGVYSYTFADPAYGLVYEYWIEWVYSASTYREQRYATGPDAPPSPSTTTYLITLAEYKAFIGIATGDTSNDTQLNALIAAVADEFDLYLGFAVIQATYSDVMNGTGNSFLRLRNIPLASITSITLDYNTPTATTFTGTDFIYNAGNGLIYFNPSSTTSGLPGYFACGNLNILATYTGGYLAANVPQQLKRAAANMIYRIVNSLSADALADLKLDQYQQKSNIVDINRELFEDVRRILDRYKVVKFIF